MAEEKEKQTDNTEEVTAKQETAEQEAPAAEETASETSNTENADKPAEEAAPEPTAEEKLAAEVESLKKELADEKEKYLRLDAEYYNYRTRSLKEKQDAYDNALMKTVTEVLGVIDNFERAASAECSDEQFKKGIDMIFKQYLTILEKLGVSEINAVGQPFDPNLHNAVSSCEDENLGENTVAAVLQKGYTLGKKVIRHAMVTVANP
ncbi:MAG: nucleotide exchange factor GrpE [Oscillospiraceae bacterium]|nr:nucleotide exchange factor GrpE [Oscillospiraceae bacterium]MDY6208625.1 nucleotide exchange factor GrpE [Oscillospiraceae bacterium]